MTLHDWLVTFTVPGQMPARYIVKGEDGEDAYRIARWKHLGDDWRWNGAVTIDYVPPEEVPQDLSITMDELAGLDYDGEEIPF